MPAPVEIRSLSSMEDCHACVAVQREVWGFDENDVVPAAVLHIVDYVGGIAAGAFDAGGTLLGFVFGVSGVRDGELSHWSHMLGVRESARNLGLGRTLKEHQRRVLAERGVKRIYWTFDPLMAKNAYFNLNRLGACVVEYVPDMYGASSSPIHLGMATDRLIVSIATSPLVPLAPASCDGLPVLTSFPRDGDERLARDGRRPPAMLVEMPADILADLSRDVSIALAWRESVRSHFQWALANGYTARGVHRDAAGRYYYMMVRRGD